MTRSRPIVRLFVTGLAFYLCACDDYFKNDYKDNSPTSGKLKVYYDEGLSPQVINQAYTFESLYPNVSIELFSTTENKAIRALLNDSCESIVITRPLNENETKAFASANYFPKYSAVAKTGVGIVCNSNILLNRISYEQVLLLLSEKNVMKDSVGKEFKPIVLFDKSNSSVVNYVLDSLLKTKKLPSFCTTLNSSVEAINYVAEHSKAILFMDFASMSDVDDSLYKANKNKIRYLAVSTKQLPNRFEFPSQSSFKLNTYPFIRTVYVVRKTGEFTLAKGFESFVAGPKGQLLFLKQGLLPTRQGPRLIQVNMETAGEKQ